MSKESELLRKLPEMVKETKAGRLVWEIECQTTEYHPSEEKVTVIEEDGQTWTVDECFVLYHCMYKGNEFVMITYEMIHSCDDKKKTTNLVFLPPLGIRYFDIHTLLPYSITADQMLIYHIHMLWLTILETQKKNPNQIALDVSERTLILEDDFM